MLGRICIRKMASSSSSARMQAAVLEKGSVGASSPSRKQMPTIEDEQDKDLSSLHRRGLQTFLQKCGNTQDLAEGKRAHAFLVRNGYGNETFFINFLVEMYGKCRSVQDARLTFDSIRHPNVFSWNIMITAYTQNGYPKEALELYRRMCSEGVQPDKFILSITLAACSSHGALAEGKLIHAGAAASGLVDAVVETALINLYGKCGSISDARSVFDNMSQRNAFSWTAMISAYAQKGHFEEALKLFWELDSEHVKPDKVTFVSILDSCAGLPDLRQGEAIHERIVASGAESDDIVGNAIISMYAKCGSLSKARSMLDGMKSRNVVTWTVMISAYAQRGHTKEALALLRKMDMAGILPNEVTFIGILDGFASASALGHGKLIHSCVIENGLDSDMILGNAIINMYGRCGSAENAKKVFDGMSSKSLVSWTAMVAAYAQNGQAKQALEISQKMDLEGMNKNTVTFITILSACNHAGLLDEGLHYFSSMSKDHGIKPSTEHYSCIIDLFGRVGRLDEAEELITGVIDRPDAVVWRTLLGACKIHGDVARAARAGEQVKKLQPANSSPYIVLSNIYAT